MGDQPRSPQSYTEATNVHDDQDKKPDSAFAPERHRLSRPA